LSLNFDVHLPEMSVVSELAVEPLLAGP